MGNASEVGMKVFGSNTSKAVAVPLFVLAMALALLDRKSTRLNSSHSQISYAVFCLKKKIKQITFRLHVLLNRHDGYVEGASCIRVNGSLPGVLFFVLCDQTYGLPILELAL